MNNQTNQNKVILITKHIALINKNAHLNIKPNIKNLEAYLNKITILGGIVTPLEKSLFAVELKDTISIVSDKNISINKNSTHVFSNSTFKTIDLRGLDTSDLESFYCMFQYCKAREINLTGLDVSNVIKMTNAFNSFCGKLVGFETLDTSSVERTDCMFQNCRMNELNLSNFNTKSLKNMFGMFDSAVIDEIKFGNFNAKGIRNMSYTFYNFVTNNLDLSNFNTKSLRLATGTFQGLICNVLNLKQFNTKRVEEMDNIFRGCKAEEIILTDIDIYNVSLSYNYKSKEALCVSITSKCNSKITRLNNKIAKFNSNGNGNIQTLIFPSEPEYEELYRKTWRAGELSLLD